jgi:hypothetical protein
MGDRSKAWARLAIAGGMAGMTGGIAARPSGYSLPLIGLAAAGGAGLAYLITGCSAAIAERRGRGHGLDGAQSWLIAGYAWTQAVWVWVSTDRRIGEDWRTLAMLTILLLGLVLLISATVAQARARRRARDPNLCPFCGYTIAGLASGTCPECGRGVVGEMANSKSQMANSEGVRR